MAILQDSIKLSLFWTRVIRVSAQTISSLILGLIVSCAYLQEDAWFKTVLQKKIEVLIADAVKADFSWRITDINLLSSTITCESLNCSDPSGDKLWAVQCPQVSIKFSWLGMLLRSRLEVMVTLHKMDIFSEIKNNSVAIAQAIRAYLESPPVIPLIINACGLRQSRLELTDKTAGTNIIALFSSDTFTADQKLKTTAALTDGCIMLDSKQYAQRLDGTLNLTSSSEKVAESAVFHLLFDAPILREDKQYTCMGNYQSDRGNLSVYNSDKTLALDITDLQVNNLGSNYKLQCKISNLINLLGDRALKFVGIDGSFTATGAFSLRPEDRFCMCSAKISNIAYGQLRFDSAEISAEAREKFIEGSYALNGYNTQLSGVYYYSFPKNSFKISFKNSQSLQLPGEIRGEPGDLKGVLRLNNEKDKNCTESPGDTGCMHNFSRDMIFTPSKNICECSLYFTARNKPHSLTSVSIFDEKKASFTGQFDNLPYTAELQYPDKLLSLVYKNSTKELINLQHTPKQDSLIGQIDDSIVKSLVSYFSGYDIKGTSKINVHIKTDWPIISVSTKLTDAQIRLPYTYNTITAGTGQASLDFYKKEIIIRDLNVKLYKGSAQCSQATGYLKQDNSFSHIFLPVSISNCLVSWKKDFFGTVSGSVAVHYNPTGYSKLKGQLVLESSHLRGNLLSKQVPQDIIKNTLYSLHKTEQDMHLELELVTRDAIKVKTPFLETSARAEILLNGTFLQPEISGKIRLSNGQLAFPYKPLYITQGTIFLTDIRDPKIELIAKNNIGKYAVTMHVSGTANNPKINFESMPYLQEEQIMTLLFSGSEEGSCSLIVTPIIIKALESLLFDADQSNSKLQRILKNILKPLKNIRIMPRINKKAGAGLSGGLEISVNERLRAMVQNNLNVTDQTQLKLEYALSDDVNILGKKDEQGNISGEIEMRWKF